MKALVASLALFAVACSTQPESSTVASDSNDAPAHLHQAPGQAFQPVPAMACADDGSIRNVGYRTLADKVLIRGDVLDQEGHVVGGGCTQKVDFTAITAPEGWHAETISFCSQPVALGYVPGDLNEANVIRPVGAHYVWGCATPYQQLQVLGAGAGCSDDQTATAFECQDSQQVYREHEAGHNDRLIFALNPQGSQVFYANVCKTMVLKKVCIAPGSQKSFPTPSNVAP